MDNKLGKYIEDLRKQKKLTQKQLAEQLGLSNTAISKWECGYNLPDISMFDPLSNVLDADIMVLLSLYSNAEKNGDFSNKSNKKKIILLICSIILLILNLIIIPTSLFIKSSKDKKIQPNEVKAYEIISEDDFINIKGLIVFNDEDNLVMLNNLKYQDDNKGTPKEIYAKSLKIVLLVDNNIIYTYETENENNKKRKLDEMINEVVEENSTFYKSEENLKALEEKFDSTTLKIEYSENGNDINTIESKIHPKSLFIN